jgi:hypothetical protein
LGFKIILAKYSTGLAINVNFSTIQTGIYIESIGHEVALPISLPVTQVGKVLFMGNYFGLR